MLNRLQLVNEWRLLSRHPLVWIAVPGAVIIAAVMASGSPAAPGDEALAQLTRLNLFFPMFILPFLAGALAPVFFTREADHGLEELFGALPVSLRDWQFMRLGSFGIALLLASMLAQAAYLYTVAQVEPGALAGLATRSAILSLAIHLPACLFWTSGLGWLACRTGRSAYLYLAAGMGWAFYIAISVITGTPMIAGSFIASGHLNTAMAVLDPYAATALVGSIQESGWLADRPLAIIVGRIVWLAACSLLVAQAPGLPSLRNRARTGESDRPSRNSGKHWRLPATLALCHLHLRYFVCDRLFLLLVGGWFLLLFPEVMAGMDYAEPLASFAPDSRDALNRVAWDIVPPACALLLLYAADRICRMFAITGMAELVAATPQESARFLIAQLSSLLLLTAFFLALAGIAALFAQLAVQSPVQWQEYARQIGLLFSRLAPFAMLFVAIHALVRQRMVANLSAGLAVAFSFTSLAPAMGLHHPLWKPLDSPLGAPDHFWGFSGSLAGHWSFTAFWTALCMAQLLLAVRLYHRLSGFRLVTRRHGLRSLPMAGAMVFAGLSLWLGVSIDRQLSAEGALVTSEDRPRWRAEYELRYGGWQAVPQPAISEVSSVVRFHPGDNRAILQATIRLLNRSDQPITRILVGNMHPETAQTLNMPVAAARRLDSALGQTVFTLASPMAPGETRVLTLSTVFERRAVEAAFTPMILRSEFSVIPAYDILPVIGFDRRLTLRDEQARKDHGLPPLRLVPPSQFDADAARTPIAMDEAVFDTVIETDIGQFGHAPGELLRRWQAGGRAHFHYRSQEPIHNLAAFFSLPNDPQSFAVGDVKLQVIAPGAVAPDYPGVLAMRDTVGWLTRDVAPYRGSTLTMIAVPQAGPTGFALPQTILISHDLGFRARPSAGAGFSQTYRRAAHETAHQWFGHLVGYGVSEDRAFLIESLAKYAELVLVERRYGRAAMEALVEYERDRYLQVIGDRPRSVLPLIDAEDNYDQYSRATLAFACLRQEIGDEAITGVLRSLAARSRTDGRPVVSRDFVELLVRARPQSRRTIKRLLLGTEPVAPMLVSVGCR